jgi:hypothetical protein
MEEGYFECCLRGEMPSPYPIYPAYRGQTVTDYHPWRRGNEEFNPQEYEVMGLAHPEPLIQPDQAVELQYVSSQPSIRRIEGPTLDPGRVLNNPSRFFAPQLISSIYQDGAFGKPADVEDSCPDPTVQRSFGQWTAAPDDMLHSVPKQLLDFDYQALNQQDIADRARLSLRKAMYGR